MEGRGRDLFMALISTNIAVYLHPDAIVGQLPDIIQEQHLNMYPHIGPITVQAIKVKRGGTFFHLPPTFPVHLAFAGKAPRNWCLAVDASLCPNQVAQEFPNQVAQEIPNQVAQEFPNQVAQEIPNQVAQEMQGTDGSKEQGVSEAPQKMEKVTKLEEDPLPISPPSPAASVTGLMTKYFPSDYDEVKSPHSPSESYGSCAWGSPLKPSRKPSKSNKLKATSSKSHVGNRVIEAGKSIVKQGSKKRSPVAAFYQSRRHRLLAGTPKAISFEINDGV